MWYYRFRNSSPLDKRVLKGLLIQKGEWVQSRVKMDFGAFKRFMEDKFETEIEPIQESIKKKAPKKRAVKKTKEKEPE